MSCLHCGSDCLKTDTRPDMPLADLLPVLDEIKAHQPGVATIVQSVGGEPLVRPDILECGREFHRRGFYWGMVSNGKLIDAAMMRELSRAGLNSLAVDLDGLREQHNWLRNDPTSFDRVYEAIGHIRRAPRLVWDVITCVNPRNLPVLEEMKRMLTEAGVTKWRCFTIAPMGRADGNGNLLLSDEQFVELMEFIKRTREEGKIDLSFSCEGYLGPYERAVRAYSFRCIAGTTTASIRANGDISGCLSIRSSFAQGNIYRDSFWDVWENRFVPYRDREWMQTEECEGCDAFDKCLGNGMHLRRDDHSLMTCHYKKIKKVLTR